MSHTYLDSQKRPASDLLDRQNFLENYAVKAGEATNFSLDHVGQT